MHVYHKILEPTIDSMISMNQTFLPIMLRHPGPANSCSSSGFADLPNRASKPTAELTKNQEPEWLNLGPVTLAGGRMTQNNSLIPWPKVYLYEWQLYVWPGQSCECVWNVVVTQYTYTIIHTFEIRKSPFLMQYR